jgi:hypothetical protein
MIAQTTAPGNREELLLARIVHGTQRAGQVACAVMFPATRERHAGIEIVQRGIRYTCVPHNAIARLTDIARERRRWAF